MTWFFICQPSRAIYKIKHQLLSRIHKYSVMESHIFFLSQHSKQNDAYKDSIQWGCNDLNCTRMDNSLINGAAILWILYISRLHKRFPTLSLITGRWKYQDDRDFLPARHGVARDDQIAHGCSEWSRPFRHPQTMCLLTSKLNTLLFDIKIYTGFKKNLSIERGRWLNDRIIYTVRRIFFGTARWLNTELKWRCSF
jgi:hypothetical protein